MDEILELLFRRLDLLILVLIFVASSLAPLFKKKQLRKRLQGPGTPAQNRPDTSNPQNTSNPQTQLEDTVRRNFEELMRRRRQQQSDSGRASTAAAPQPPSAPVRRPVPVPRGPVRSPVPQPAIPRAAVGRQSHEPEADQPDRSWDSPHRGAPDRDWGSAHQSLPAGPHSPWDSEAAYGLTPGKRESQAHHLLSARSLRGNNLRRALLLKEILDPPVSLREVDLFDARLL